jgi:Spy/CpxP family protein refolding chaperone
MIMSTVIRSILVAAALVGTVSAVSAAPRHVDNPYTYSNPNDFNPATFFDDLQRKLG